MTQKRYKKLMMAKGYSRNDLDIVPDSMLPGYKTYSDFYRLETDPYAVRFENCLYSLMLWSAVEDFDFMDLCYGMVIDEAEKNVIRMTIESINAWFNERVNEYRDTLRSRLRKLTREQLESICSRVSDDRDKNI